MKSSPSSTSRCGATAGARAATGILATSAVLLLGAGVLGGCGSGENAGDGSSVITPFGASSPAASSAASPSLGAAGSSASASSTNPGASSEQTSPLPIVMMPGGTPAGQQAGAAGAPMQMDNAQASMQVCTPGQVTCDGANTIATCNADGLAATITRCPNGTNCQGAGQCTPVACNPGGVKPNSNSGQQYPASYNGNGSVTVYWFAQGTLSVPPGPNQDVNCGFGASRANNDDGGQNDRVADIQDPGLFGAMNGAEYLGSNACGTCVELSQGGRSTTITIADSCKPENGNPSCTPGHIDLSRNAFQQLTGQSTGNIGGITWRYVPCAGMGNVKFQLKKPDDQYWNEFIVVNHKYPIKSAQIQMKDGTWVDAVRQDDNNWRASYMGTDGVMGTYRVRVTDINGAIIEEQLALQGGLQEGHAQFECQ